MRVLKSAGLVCLLGLSFVDSSFAATRYVNATNPAPVAPYTNWATASTNIQTAINAAASGDEILVAPGVYRIAASVSMPAGKTLTLRSTQSRAATIDAQRLCEGVLINSTNSVVEGFTVRNGISASYGGGFYLANACTVRDCLVTSNQSWGAGGVFLNADGAVVENCTIQSNLATYWGGGVVLYNGFGGLVDNCIISDNISSNYAGGIAFQGGGTASNCWIADNRALVESGGGASMEQGGTLVNSVVVGNVARQDGGGVYNFEGKVMHCTVVSNTAGRYGGGIRASYSTNWNSIMYFNTAPTNTDVWLQDSVFENCCVSTNLGGANFTNAPAFANFAGRDFRLAAGSSCIDAGASGLAVTSDYAGNPRPVPGVLGGAALFDVGAFEYQIPVEVCDGIDNDGDSQVDEDCRSSSSYFSINQAVRCTSAGWSRAFAMDLTNFRNIAVQDGYQSYTVSYALFYNIWTGLYLFDYDAGAFTALTWLTNLDL